MSTRLDRSFFGADPVTVARRLLGQRLVHVVDGERRAGTIIETEAYLGVPDKAAHSFQWRRTPRTETMFAAPGTAYVFLNYGIHRLLNIVVAEEGDPKAVLIRALWPEEGLDAMADARPAARSVRDLCSGPGKLGAALGIELEHDGVDMTTSRALFVERVRMRAMAGSRIVACPRIGVDYAEEWAAKPLRFCVRGHSGVSVRPPAEHRAP